MPKKFEILLIDDDIAESKWLNICLSKALQNQEYSLKTVFDVSAALLFVVHADVDLIFLDNRVPPTYSASESISLLREKKCEAPIIVISSHFDQQDRVKLASADVRMFEKSQLTPKKLKTLVESHCFK